MGNMLPRPELIPKVEAKDADARPSFDYLPLGRNGKTRKARSADADYHSTNIISTGEFVTRDVCAS